ncbi:YhgE/Pip domain-containing protein [Streptomyces yunnanensis]|uniref:YhgE/Pip domain-containing protein n=1 Tax=Streptomyces yunnanensis TaxID=156453 RepID=A0ABY8ACR6_9ACTN|nr:YhgE/Pip domain-containing protein [Streptomyces yunnanensis]WEB42499.1 YhgE/Pip domain-containing protein [Streptomyces yunnanensis]
MRSPKLAALELRRFGRGKLPRLGLVALMLIPLLYGALYLCSFWDPYSRLDKIPVALVNEDQGATADGKKLTAGADLARNVKDSKTFDWEEVGAADAAKGLEKGDYYLSLTVPKDFSQKIASSGGDDPQTGALQVRTNDANNYIVGSISKTVFSEIRAKTSSKSTRAFLDKIFVSFSDLHDETAKAADGAGKVDDGLGTAREKTGELADGLGKLNDGAGKLDKGAGELDNGLGKLGKGAGDLNNGAGQLGKGAGQLQNGASQAAAKSKELSDGARRVADGTQQLVDKVDGLAKKDLPYLKQHGQEIAKGAQVVVNVTEVLDDILGKLTDADNAAAQAQKTADNNQALYEKRCTGGSTDADCATMKANAVGAANSAGETKQLKNAIAQLDLGQLRTKLREVHQGAQMVADQVPDLVKNADGQLAQLNELNAGAHKVAQGAGQFAGGLGALANGAGDLANGAGRLHKGAGDLENGAGRLQNGAGDLADGMGQLHNGLGTAHDGAEKLSGGLYKLKDGANQLATGLHNGVAKIPDYDKKDRDARTGVMADPVALAAKSMHKAPNYGTGLAPYFIPLSLWVGAMVAFMLLAPLGKRALAAGAPGWRIALGSWLPAFAIGVVQVLALMAVLHWALGLEMERAGATIGFLMLGTACFTALIQLLSAFFGPAGRVLTLVVLMLQLTSAGGTYPVQTSPGFFSWIHPFLPMSYVVDGLRRLITGGDLDVVWQGSVVLAAFTLGALALTALAARSRQVVRMKDLHPELSL